MRDDDNGDQYRWPEYPWVMTSNPQKLEKIPDPSRFENEFELKDYVYKLLSFVIRLFFSNYVGLSQSGRKRIKRITRAYWMYLDDIPDKEIASDLRCSVSTVSRDRADIEKKLRHFEVLHLELKDCLENNGDKFAQEVLKYNLDGKSREETICELGLTPKVVDEASKRIRKISRKIQKELEGKKRKTKR